MVFILIALIQTASAQPVSEIKTVKPEPTRGASEEPAPKVETVTTSSQLKRAILPRPADDARARAVLNNLVKSAGWFPNITIQVHQGVVTIQGSVKNADHLRWLADTADRIPSVLAVINQATVETPPVSDFTPAIEEFRGLIESSKKRLPLLVVALVLALIFLFVGRHIQTGVMRLWRRQINNPFLLNTVARLTMLPVWILLFYLVLQVAGLSALAATIIGGTGAMGIVLGFAFKDIAENYISGLILSIRSPFTKGDEVVIDRYEGYIQSLSMRGTTITDYDGMMVLIPNRIVLQSVIKNLSVNSRARVVLTFGIGLEDSIQGARELISGAFARIPAIVKDPAASVTALEITKNAITLRVVFWYEPKRSSKFGTISEAIESIQRVLLGAGYDLMTEVRQVAAIPADKGAGVKPAPTVKRMPGAESASNKGREDDAFRVSRNAESMHSKPDADLFEH